MSLKTEIKENFIERGNSNGKLSPEPFCRPAPSRSTFSITSQNTGRESSRIGGCLPTCPHEEKPSPTSCTRKALKKCLVGGKRGQRHQSSQSWGAGRHWDAFRVALPCLQPGTGLAGAASKEENAKSFDISSSRRLGVTHNPASLIKPGRGQVCTGKLFHHRLK